MPEIVIFLAEGRTPEVKRALMKDISDAVVPAETAGELDQFCTKCHSPLGFTRGETRVAYDEAADVFRQATQGLSPQAMMGVSCEVCHSITSIEERLNGNFTMQLDGVRRGSIRGPVTVCRAKSNTSRKPVPSTRIDRYNLSESACNFGELHSSASVATRIGTIGTS